jgi:CubicO group peptidase (beta-lactamase class C family)
VSAPTDLEHELRTLLDSWARSGREPGGAVCVRRRGRVLANVRVGTTDGVQPWADDTLVMTYSVAKPFAALTVLAVVAEGRLGLDDRVAELWPAYAANGKGATTVRHVLAHQAGVPVFPEAAADLPFDATDDLDDLLADAVPWHEPGRGIAEHALTYGHLCDRLVRASTGEGLAERFAGLAAAHGWDLHLRVAEPDLARVADLVALEPWPRPWVDDPRWGPALTRPAGLLDPAVLSSRRWRTTSFAAIGLHASAAGLAAFYDDLARTDGAVADLLGPDLFAAYVGTAATGHDRLLDREVRWTLGFQVDEEDLGMGGVGGCVGWRSVRQGYAAAWVTRGLGDPARSDEVWETIERAL